MNNEEIMTLYLKAYTSKKAADLDALKDRAKYKQNLVSKSGPYYDMVSKFEPIRKPKKRSVLKDTGSGAGIGAGIGGALSALLYLLSKKRDKDRALKAGVGVTLSGAGLGAGLGALSAVANNANVGDGIPDEFYDELRHTNPDNISDAVLKSYGLRRKDN